MHNAECVQFLPRDTCIIVDYNGRPGMHIQGLRGDTLCITFPYCELETKNGQRYLLHLCFPYIWIGKIWVLRRFCTVPSKQTHSRTSCKCMLMGGGPLWQPRPYWVKILPHYHMVTEEICPSLFLPRNVTKLQHLLIQFLLYYLSSGHLWEVKNKRKFQTFSS